MTDIPVKPWDDSLDLKWQETVNSWHWKPVDSDDPTVLTYRIKGTCPYCNDPMSQDEKIGIGFGARYLIRPEPDSIIHGRNTFREAVGGALPETVTVSCNCDVKHAPDKKGCGKHGQILFADNINES
ncbi:MAG: hypothetical protein NVS4B7_12850 [Ktedonobacteraceae bacterium]